MHFSRQRKILHQMFDYGVNYFLKLHYNSFVPVKMAATTEDGSTEALLQILYGQYLILGVFGSCMF